MTETSLLTRLRDLETYVNRDQHAQAAALCCALIADPLPAVVYSFLSQTAQKLGDFDAMVLAAQQAVASKPRDFSLCLRLAECYLYAGYTERCLAELNSLESNARNDGQTLQLIGNLYVHCSAHREALRCFEQAMQVRPGYVPYLYNVATSCVALGHIDRAQALFDTVIMLQPGDFGAYVNRAMLKTWGPQDHHLDALREKLASLPDGHSGQVPLCYALAKELEDLGDFDASFSYLRQGAKVRRASLAYRVENEVAALDAIRETFTAEIVSRVLKSPPQEAGADFTPVFVLGLPRSGTTLVERILSSHSRIGSVGEVNNLAFALMHVAAGPGGKKAMIARSVHADMARLQAIYMRGLAGYGVAKKYIINKTPENYLYLGLIAMSMPSAKVIHLERHALDSCYAMFKTLFRMGYPYSYSLDDLGKYYVAYHRLMQHWREVLPGKFLDVRYEDLVANQETVARNMLSYCGVEWQDTCLNFHKNSAPSATASAAQVRRPIYQSSVARWKLYEQHLRPLADYLSANGINCT